MSIQGQYTEEGHTRRTEDTKGVISGSTPQKDTQEVFEDTKGVIRSRPPK
jgi:hypothetical protein